jgi:UDP-N-acetylmuramate--alanine ligase
MSCATTGCFLLTRKKRQATMSFDLRHMFTRLSECGFSPVGRVLAVDSSRQILAIFENGVETCIFPAGTSLRGLGNMEGSFMTPPGVHRIAAKIGAVAPAGRIFRDRKDTGIDWNPGEDVENLILTRILRLEGCETGINKGPGIDTFDRYIYIHGTNRENLVGVRPFSHGCVCMKNSDIISLFDKTEAGDAVYIN